MKYPTSDNPKLGYLDLCGEALWCWLRGQGELPKALSGPSSAPAWYLKWLDDRMILTCPKLAEELAALSESDLEYIWGYVRSRSLLRAL